MLVRKEVLFLCSSCVAQFRCRKLESLKVERILPSLLWERATKGMGSGRFVPQCLMLVEKWRSRTFVPRKKQWKPCLYNNTISPNASRDTTAIEFILRFTLGRIRRRHFPIVRRSLKIATANGLCPVAVMQEITVR